MTWDDVLATALGQMKLDPAVFWRMSWREFALAQRGFFEMKNEELKSQWEQTRVIAFWSTKDTKQSVRRPQQLFKLAWDDSEVKLPTKEDMRYWMLKYGKHIDEQGNSYNA